jgi:hypothetical protein
MKIKLTPGQNRWVWVGIWVVVAAVLSPLMIHYDDTLSQAKVATEPDRLPTAGVNRSPGVETKELGVILNQSYSGSYGGLINKALDPSRERKVNLAVEDVSYFNKNELSFNNSENDAITEFDFYLTGKEKDVQVNNKIKISVDYEAVPEWVNVFYSPGYYYPPDSRAPDEPSYSVPFLPLLSSVLNSKSKLVEASTANKENLKKALDRYLRFNRDMPDKLKALLAEPEQDAVGSYILKQDEKLALPVVVYFQEPGAYTLRFGVEYRHGQNTETAWLERSVKVYVSKSYNLWTCDKQGWRSGENSCDFYRFGGSG